MIKPKRQGKYRWFQVARIGLSWTAGVFWLLLAAVSAFSQDVVSYREPHGPADARRQVAGEILDYTEDRLRLRLETGRVLEIPAEHDLHIESDWSEDQLAGDQLLARGQFREALLRYGKALEAERRAWVRHRILARAVWCFRYVGDFRQAGETFLQLLKSNADTPYFDAIPLVWWPYQPPASLEPRARRWMLEGDQPAAALMGASWLLSGRDATTAKRALQQLASSGDDRIRTMAQAQLWRNQVVTATEEDLAAWRMSIEEMPHGLRAGPYFVLGKGRVQHDRPDAAAVTFLRVPILYNRHRALAAESLLEAARLFEKSSRLVEAQRMYREVAERYGETSAAELARQRIDRSLQTSTE